MRHIIGIAGKARSGKDTIADYLANQYGYRRFAFADPMKTTINPLFGWGYKHAYGELKDQVDPAWGFSPRQVYQLFGTEFGRALDTNLWVKIADFQLKQGIFVIPDVRFDNEAEFCRNNGLLIHVERPGVEAVNAHSSEDGVMMEATDYCILNDQDINHLHRCVDTIINEVIDEESIF